MSQAESLFEHSRKQWAAGMRPWRIGSGPLILRILSVRSTLLAPTGCSARLWLRTGCPRLSFGGPPGSGKTTLARLVAAATRARIETISAVTSGVADLRRIVAEARETQAMHQQRTVLFVDEIHRFNKAQQDVILPHVEDGTVTFIGATTENPSFEVISPLLSRCRVFTLEPLSEGQVAEIVRRALEDEARGLGKLSASLDQGALDQLTNAANGDARVALNALETAAFATAPDESGHRSIDLETISDALQRRSGVYDKAGDGHYDTISAFIKSVRGSSPDGALYWLARMIEAGEDPMFIARRLVILAAEDIGLAQPEALPVAVAAQQAVHFLGCRRAGYRWPRPPFTWPPRPRATRRTQPWRWPWTTFVNVETNLSRCICETRSLI